MSCSDEIILALQDIVLDMNLQQEDRREKRGW